MLEVSRAGGPCTSQNRPGQRQRPSAWPGWTLLFLLCLALYGATASRGAQWQDSGCHILRIVTGQSISPLGLALSHPLHHWLGRLAILPGLGEPCVATTLLSGLAAAVAVANVYGCVLTLSGRRSAAAFAAASLALANTFWQMATLTESYTLCAALLAGECWCLITFTRAYRAGALYGMTLLNGLGIANHLLASLTTPVIALVVVHAWLKGRIAARHVGVAAVLWLAGTLSYSTMVAAQMVRSGDVLGTIRSALFGVAYAGNVLNTSLSWHVLLIALGFPVLNFPNLLLPASIYGLIRGRRLDLPVAARRALSAALFIHLVFVSRYNIVDQQTFFLPLYVLLAIFGGLGAAAVLQSASARWRRLLVLAGVGLLLTTPLVYQLTTMLTRKYQLLGASARHKPYRDDCVYLFTPWSVVERSAERMSSQALRLAGPRGLIIPEERMAAFALEYKARRFAWGQLEIARHSSAQRIRQAVAEHRPVVLVPRQVGQTRVQTPVGAWKPAGDLYVLGTGAGPPTTATTSSNS